MDIVTPLPRVDSAANFHHSRTNSFSDFGVSQIQLTESSVTVPDTPVQQTASSWEPSVAQRIRQGVLENATVNRPYMVALVGTPGSGKSVSSMLLASMLDETDCDCMVMPHDGYHFTLEHLKIFFPDPEQAVYRRGAPDTFDPQALHRDLLRIKEGDEEFITLPAFDHANGDPEPDRHAFDRSKHKVVLCEGLYLLHDADGWEDIRKLFDLAVFMDSDVDQCIERVKVRNKCIPGYTHEEILVRCEEVDRVNAMTVMASKQYADIVVDARFGGPPQPKPPLTPAESEANTMTHVLSQLELKDEELVEDNVLLGGDWALDIASRPTTDPDFSHPASVASERRDRSDSIWSQTSHETTPEPASAFVGSWEPRVAEQIQDNVRSHSLDRPYMVALVGIPGSGKTISSFMLANFLDEAGFQCMVMPHDGYHYPLEHLKTFPDAEDAIYRRGAPDTFDALALQRDLDRIRDGEEELITLPAFDHSRGDPEPDTHAFDRSRHQVVLCEGLYLLHNDDGWQDVASKFDLTIFMDSNVDNCIERVKIRNQCIPGYTAEQIVLRCEEVDRVNAMTVMQCKDRADIVVQSIANTSQANLQDIRETRVLSTSNSEE